VKLVEVQPYRIVTAVQVFFKKLLYFYDKKVACVLKNGDISLANFIPYANNFSSVSLFPEV